MILVDRQIKALCDKEDGFTIVAGSCVVNHGQKGLVEPFNPELVNPSSIDILVGDTIMVEDPNEKRGHSLFETIDMQKEGFSIENPFWVQPGEFILVASHETFNLLPTICGEFRLKSSRAREGWDQSLAVWLDNGWHGSKLTMELKNNLRYSALPIYPGLKIGQVVFYKTDLPEKPYSATGRYNNDQTVMGSKG